MDNINSIDSKKGKIKAKIEELYNNGFSLEYEETEKDIFNNNLILIDSLLPNILSKIVELFYTSRYSRIVDIVKEIELKNPLNFDMKHNHKYYEYKIKKFLTEIAVGMMPGSVWQGVYDATGGYLIVKDNGDILAYHLYNRNEFEDYLFYNTKLDTASSSRHDFGKIYEKDGEYFFKLNLQIRFVK